MSSTSFQSPSGSILARIVSKKLSGHNTWLFIDLHPDETPCLYVWEAHKWCIVPCHSIGSESFNSNGVFEITDHFFKYFNVYTLVFVPYLLTQKGFTLRILIQQTKLCIYVRGNKWYFRLQSVRTPCQQYILVASEQLSLSNLQEILIYSHQPCTWYIVLSEWDFWQQSTFRVRYLNSQSRNLRLS